LSLTLQASHLGIYNIDHYRLAKRKEKREKKEKEKEKEKGMREIRKSLER